MTENEGQAKGLTKDETPLDASPAEKLEDKPTGTGSLTPGAENPESQEIKKEINPNTE
ncbi:MAG TPA: hypothetical protein VF666_18535 [Pyrinomonadaceae bacterium]|jgi:hypothetical protein